MPKQIGKYVIERVLGAGGMGTVYLGHHVDTKQAVAVKVLPSSMSREPGFVARFDREVEAMQKLSSPNIVELYESGEDNGTYYYAMEYVDGTTLTERLAKEKRLDWRETIDIGIQICVALKAAHNAGIIHRDLKPSNLMLGRDGTVKLTDFGIAQVFATSKLTVTGGILGTAEYMSPEQAQGKRASKHSDIYSLGAVLYVMLTGRPPFTGKTTLEICQKHKFGQFDSPRRIVPEIPHWLDEIVCQCLSKKPEDRYPDAYVLNLRLAEIPKKVELSQQSAEFVYDGSSPTQETMADGAIGGGMATGDQGALVRDLFRAQMEEEQTRTGLAKVFDNVYVLIGLLLLIVVGAYGLSLWNRVNPEAMFARGEELMEKPEGPAWMTAKREYFEPLLALDEETWGDKVAPLMKQIEVYELQKDFMGRDSKSLAVPKSEPEAVIKQAIALSESGRVDQAIDQLNALVALLEGQSEQKAHYDIAVKIRDQLVKVDNDKRFAFLEESLKRAKDLQEHGDTEQARVVWKSLIDLYDGTSAADDYVEQARAALKAAGSAADATE